MKYWCDIISKHNPEKIAGAKNKDHGTFSEKSVVALLIYLANGPDFANNISQYFVELSNSIYPEESCPSALKYPGKVSSILKRMEDEELAILVAKKSAKAGVRKYYKINPKILQSPIKDEACLKPDGSIFQIPLDSIERLLECMSIDHEIMSDNIQDIQEEKSRIKRHKRLDEFFETFLSNGFFDFKCFLNFIKFAAIACNSLGDSNILQPELVEQLICYIHLSPH
jgi:hypothetical protein